MDPASFDDALDEDYTTIYPSIQLRPRAVLATNLSPLCTKHDVYGFFSFCGKIQDIKLRKSKKVPSDDTLESIVLFDSESAQQTALLLHGSTILDKDVCIEPAPENWNVSKLASVGGDAKAPTAARKATTTGGPTNDVPKSSDGIAAMSVSALASTAALSLPGDTVPNAAAIATSETNPNASSQSLSSVTSAMPAGWQSAVSSWWNSAKTIANEEVEAYKRGEYEQLLREAVEYTSKKSSELGRSLQEQTSKGATQVSRSLTELEEKMELDRRLNESLTKMEKMAADVDNRLRISERSGVVVKIGSEKLQEFDERFYMSQRLQSAADNTLSNEAIASLIRDVNARTAQLWQSAQELFTEAERKTNQLLLGETPPASSTPASANAAAGGVQDAVAPTIDGAAVPAPSAPVEARPADPAKP